MATPYRADYGTVSGQSRGLRGGPVRDDEEFSTLQDRVGAGVLEINQQTRTLRQLYQQIGTSSDSDRVRGRIQTTLRSTVEKVLRTTADLEQLMQIGQSSGNPVQRLAAKSLQQQVQKSEKDFNALSRTILERLKENREPPRSQGSLSHEYLDSGELNDSARLLHSHGQRQLDDLFQHFQRELEDSAQFSADSYTHTQQQQEVRVSREARLAEERAYADYMVKADVGQLNELMGRIAHIEQGDPSGTTETQASTPTKKCCCICC